MRCGSCMMTGVLSFAHSVFGLQFMDELLQIEAHDSEVLCLEFSPPETGKSADAAHTHSHSHTRTRTHTHSVYSTLECWSAGVLECWSAGVLECWSAGVLECWSAGVLECWSAGVLECWSAGVLECWSAGVRAKGVSVPFPRTAPAGLSEPRSAHPHPQHGEGVQPGADHVRPLRLHHRHQVHRSASSCSSSFSSCSPDSL